MEQLYEWIERQARTLPRGILIQPPNEFQLKLAWLSSAPGPRGDQRFQEDVTAAGGNSLSITNSRLLGIPEETLRRWFQGVSLARSSVICPAIVQDYPLFRQNGELAGIETDRLAALLKSHWYFTPPPDLNVCPSNLVIKPDKMRIVHDFSHQEAGINAALINRDVDYATIDRFTKPLGQYDFMAGIDFQDCFLHWLVAPQDRRLLGIRHPTSGQLGTYLFLPFGLGPSPGENDRSVKDILRHPRMDSGTTYRGFRG